MSRLPLRPCVGVLLCSMDRLVFAGQRVDRFADAWQMPQGGIDAGETPRDAVLRELHEETGLTADQVEVLDESSTWLNYELPAGLVGRLWSGKYRGQTQKWFACRLQAGEEAINIAAGPDPEFRCWAWMRPADLAERVVPFKRAVYDQVFTEFAGWLR